MRKGFSSLPKSTKFIVVLLGAFIMFWCVVLLAMYLWAIWTSLKTIGGFRGNMFGPPKGWPWEWEWANFSASFTNISLIVTQHGIRRKVFLVDMLFNTLLYATLNAVLTTFYTWLAAYLISRFPNFWSKFVFGFNLVMMFVPIQGNLAASLQLNKALGLYDNWGYVIFNAIGFGGMRLLIFHTFLEGLGKEYTEAARIDGAGNFDIMFKIMIPLSSQLLLSIAVMIFMAKWNDYMTMVIWMPNYPTLAYGIWRFSSVDTTKFSWPPLQIAACMILVVPVLVIYFFVQKMLLENIRVGGLK